MRMTPLFHRPLLALALVPLALLMGPQSVLAQTAGETADAGAYLAARSAALNNSYREGAYWFERALAGDPANTALMDGAVISLMGEGEVDKAAAIAERMVAAGGRSIAANIAIMAKNAKSEAFDAIAAAPPERAIGNLLDDLVRAWAEFGKGKVSEAIALFDAIAAKDGLQAFGLYHKSLALAAVGDFEGANEILSGKAAGTLVVNRRGVIAHVQILSQLEMFAEALALLERSFGTDPDPELDPIRQSLAAGTALPFGMVTSASDGISEVFFTVAAALTGEADPSYTILYARSAAYLNPKHTEAILMTGRLLQQLDQHLLAAEAFGTIGPENPSYYSAEIGRAEAQFALGDKETALATLEGLTKSHPELTIVHVAYGDALRREERFEAAATAYDVAVALTPVPEERHWALFYTRGIAHERSKQWEKAEADFRMALTLNPDQPQVLNYLGYSFVDRGENLDEALGMIERAVAERPDAGYIIDSLAWAYFRLGRYQDALPQMERASLLEPVDPIVTDHLGDVYWAVGRKLEARFQWRRALSFEPEEKEAIRIRRKLEVGLDVVLQEEGAPPLKAQNGSATGN